ncbi:hypothetical protein FQA39_LY14358 [Lamprigera yunnana]|nr:hypothetical protein FQA39_LY14358 [Lamprigera yunnana]
MKILEAIIVLTSVAIVRAENVAHQNIAKRGLVDQVTYYTDPVQVRYIQSPVYRDIPSTNIPPHSHVYVNPKLVDGAQQVLYEYPSIHQHVQTGVPTNLAREHVQVPGNHLINHPHGVVPPVQHGAVINHVPNYPRILYPQTTNAPAHPYQNNKILFHPHPYRAPLPQQPAPVVTQKPFKPSPPLIYSPKIAKEEIDEDKMADVKDEDEMSEHEEYENYEEDEEDAYKPYNKYRDEEDDDDDDDTKSNYKCDNDDDHARSYSRNVRQKPHKHDYKNSSKKPKSQYKSYTYSSYSKPNKGSIEGRQTVNVPVIRKHNTYHQEKWIVTKKD